ncbi:MAG: GIY-YIG nuclease family protein, partial [Candidatus Binatia bacterium]|nr:GIY-YIG nuclease family protein [Candidatus Binatia bacterium]
EETESAEVGPKQSVATVEKRLIFNLTDKRLPVCVAVYRLFCEETGDDYVGGTRNFARRMSELKNNNRAHVNHMIKEIGARAFTVEILESPPEDTLRDREQFWFNRIQPTLCVAVDVRAPMKFRTHTPLARMMISTKQKGRIGRTQTEAENELQRQKMTGAGNPRFGVFVLQSTKDKITAALTGKKRSLVACAKQSESIKRWFVLHPAPRGGDARQAVPVFGVRLSDGAEVSFKSIVEAAAAVGTPASNICDNIVGRRRKSAGGYKWRRA